MRPALRSLRSLHPGYFSVVMATGIVALAAQLEGIRPVAVALGWLIAEFQAQESDGLHTPPRLS